MELMFVQKQSDASSKREVAFPVNTNRTHALNEEGASHSAVLPPYAKLRAPRDGLSTHSVML